jgi:PilZ domain-containing protein
MGKRREPRKEITVAVRIFGTDKGGQTFSEKVSTINVSREGVRLSGVQARPNIDEIVGVTYGQTKAHFRVKWVGEPGTPHAGQMGLLNLVPEKVFWDFPLPPPSVDTSGGSVTERRRSPRLKCASSAEVYPAGVVAPIRTRTSDLSIGGCFLEMSTPVPKKTQVRIALWVKDAKLWANGEVITSSPGFGIGVKFTEIAADDRRQLQEFLDSMIRIRR